MNRVIIVCSVIGLLFGGREEEEAAPEYFPGGSSEISSDDPQRAKKAIRKWSEKEKALVLSWVTAFCWNRH